MDDLYKKVYDCVEYNLVEFALVKHIPPCNVRDEFHWRVANLQICYQHEYRGRESRMLVNAYHGVLKKYEGING